MSVPEELKSIALSSIKRQLVSRYLSSLPDGTTGGAVDVTTLQEKAVRPNAIYPIREVKDVPLDYLKGAYRAMCRSFLSFGYPTTESNEASVSASMSAILKSLRIQLLNDPNFSKTLEVQVKSEANWEWTFDTFLFKGRTDYQVNDLSTAPASVLLVVECKSNSFNSAVGLLQAEMFAKRIWDSEKRKVSLE